MANQRAQQSHTSLTPAPEPCGISFLPSCPANTFLSGPVHLAVKHSLPHPYFPVKCLPFCYLEVFNSHGDLRGQSPVPHEPVHPRLTSLVFFNVVQSSSQGGMDSYVTQCFCLPELTLFNPLFHSLMSWSMTIFLLLV